MYGVNIIKHNLLMKKIIEETNTTDGKKLLEMSKKVLIK